MSLRSPPPSAGAEPARIPVPRSGQSADVVARVLLVEDDAADAYMLRRMIETEGGDAMTVEHVVLLSEALARLAEGGVDVVLLDLDLPDSFGLGTFQKVRHQAFDVPVVVLSGLDDQMVAISAVREGAQDYLVKGQFEGQLLMRAVFYAMERHQTQELLRNLSLADDLTGLYNRRGFLTLAEQQMKLAMRNKRGLLLVFADLDGLKQINDSLGHEAGNQAIVDTAELLRQSFRETDILARLGGDEFVVLLIETDAAGFASLEERLRSGLVEMNQRPEPHYELSLSLGTAELDPEDPCDLEQLIRQADVAMYAEKRKKKAQSSPGPQDPGDSAIQARPE